MYIPRTIEAALKSSLAKYPVVTLTGPRQSGKTTMLRHVLRDTPYVNLEALRERQFAEQDPIGFLNRFGEGVVLDEIQRVPSLLSEIQVRADASQRPGMFVISGSENLTISRHVSQSLAGRTAILKLLPLSLAETREKRGGAHGVSLDELLLRGFYPRGWAGGLSPQDVFAPYVETFVERDVRDLLAVKNLALFRKFLVLCAGRVGQLLNKDSISSDVGVSSKTIEEWLSVLETTFVVTRLPPWFRNVGKRLVKSPKLYFFDVGLVCFLLGIETAVQLARHPLRGLIFESMVVADAFKQAFHRGGTPRLHFFRDSQDNEIDLIIQQGERLQPVEIKSAETYDPSFLKGPLAFSKLVGDEAKTPIVVMGGGSAQERTNVHILPWTDWSDHAR